MDARYFDVVMGGFVKKITFCTHFENIHTPFFLLIKLENPNIITFSFFQISDIQRKQEENDQQ